MATAAGTDYMAAFDRATLAFCAMALALTAIVTLGGAALLGVISWAPKWPDQAWLWVLNNLLLVTLVEEALFRGYIQGGLSRRFKHLSYGENLALYDWPLFPGQRPRAVVLIVHGLGENAWRYDHVAKRLNDWGFQVRAYSGNERVDTVSLQRLSVDSVSFSGGSIYMLLQDGSTRAYNDVLAFM